MTGKLTREIFADDCSCAPAHFTRDGRSDRTIPLTTLPPGAFPRLFSFVDPTNDTVGLDRYLRAVDVLFDGEESELKLLSIDVVDDRTIKATWTLAGVLKFPWRPRIQPFEGAVPVQSPARQPMFAGRSDLSNRKCVRCALARRRSIIGLDGAVANHRGLKFNLSGSTAQALRLIF